MRGSLSTALVTLAVAFSAVVPSRASAQDASNQAAAQALFDQARQLMADGKYAEACPKLVESQKLDPGAGTLVNLGACYEKNGQTASAWVTFKDAAAAADLKHRADWSQRARERAQALEPLLSKLTIEVPAEASAVAGLQVRRDGVEVGSAEWGTPIPMDPGDHAVEAVAPAKKRWTTTVHVGATSDMAHVAVPVLEDEPAASAPPTAPVVAPAPLAALPISTEPPPPPPTDGSTQRVVGLVVGGAGIVGVGVGLIFGVVAMGKESSSKNLCPTTSCTSAAAVKDNDDAKSSATISTVGIVAGGVLLAAGVVVYFTAPKKRDPAAAFHLAPSVGAGQIGLNVGGAW